MGPGEALHDPAFQFYALTSGGLLLAATAVLALLHLALGKDVSHAWRSLRGWLIMVPILLGVVLGGRVVTIIFFTILALLAYKEFARATGLYRDWVFSGVVSLGIIATGVVAMVPAPRHPVQGWYGLYMALPIYVIAALLMVPIFRNRARGQLQLLSLAIVGFVYFGWMFGHIGFLCNATHALPYILFIVFAVEITDVSAYTIGKLWGRHPLRSNISPNKTWEGALGALAVAMALPWLLRFTFPHFTPWDCILTGLIVGVGGQMGDLAISTVKRDIGVKDMGAILPGHGGILDRVDSLIYVAPLFFHMVRYTHGIY